jgi:acyl-CoA thioesterase FadM
MGDTLDAFRSDFRFNYLHEVEYREIDMMQHVNNVRYCEWAETIRCMFFADVIGEDLAGSAGAILAKHDMDYDNVVRNREKVLIGGRVSRWGSKSFDFETHVWSLDHERRVFRSTAVLVAYDYANNRSIAIPAVWRERVDAAT